MINFVDGQINIGERNILSASNEDLNFLAEEGFIEKRENTSGTYYYVEDEANGMKFRIFVSLRGKRIGSLRLHWLDGPIKGWDDVSEKAARDEYRLLCNFIGKTVGGPPDNKGNRKHAWRCKWGQIEVCYEPRTYQADIFMKPWRDRQPGKL